MKKYLLLLLFLLFITTTFGADIIYKVKEGDNIVGIARENLNNPSEWRELLKYNNLSTPDSIKAGMNLKIPSSLYKNNSPRKDEPIAVIVFTQGEVKYKISEKESEWKPVSVGLKLFPDYILRTMNKSSAEINFFDKPSTVIEMRENSIIKLKQEKVRGIELTYGDLFISTLKTNLKNVKFMVETVSSSAAIRGTKFGVSTDEVQTDRFRCFTGEISVTAENETVYVKEGYGTLVEKGKPPRKPFKLLGAINTKPIEEPK